MLCCLFLCLPAKLSHCALPSGLVLHFLVLMYARLHACANTETGAHRCPCACACAHTRACACLQMCAPPCTCAGVSWKVEKSAFKQREGDLFDPPEVSSFSLLSPVLVWQSKTVFLHPVQAAVNTMNDTSPPCTLTLFSNYSRCMHPLATRCTGSSSPKIGSGCPQNRA